MRAENVAVEVSTDKDKRIIQLEAELKKMKSNQRYGLVWEDHPEELDDKNVIPLLNKRDDLSLEQVPDKPQNYLIEGDNYHALKTLQHTHKGLVDVIYIDPPYNTGNQDFVYNDKMVDIEDGFRHSKWLSFMEKRLKLARNLMTDEGVIFVSIGDDEQAQLKMLMDKIFGEQNSISSFIWEKTYSPKNNNKYNSTNHEYILVFTKDKDKLKSFNRLDRTVENNKMYIRDDNDGRGLYRIGDLTAPASKHDFDIVFDNKTYKLSNGLGWRFNKDKMQELIDDNRIFFPDSEESRPGFKRYLSDVGGVVTKTILEYDVVGHTDGSKRDLDLLMGVKGLFDYPKPVGLVKYLVKLHPNKNAITLDFFAGSGTTGDAIMKLNKEDGGNRSFILCTNNEVSDENERNYLHEKGLISKNNKTVYNKYKKDNPEDYAAFLDSDEYQTLGIARAVTRERIKRVIEGYTTPKGKVVEGLPNNLSYLQTHEFDKLDARLSNRKELVKLALNSHYIKYPESDYETVIVDIMFDVDAYVIQSKDKELVFFLDFRDTKSMSLVIAELFECFGKDIKFEMFENYYEADRGR